jgi:type IV pilus assembly protein PilY1
MNLKNIGRLVLSGVGNAVVLLSASLGVHSLAHAQVTAATSPMFLSSSADPNIMFVLDDSGSMHWEITPDEYLYSYYVFPRATGNYGGSDYNNNVLSFRDAAPANATEQGRVAALRSSHVNKTYYNPSVTYLPWSKPEGMAFTAAVPAVTASSAYFPAASPTAAPNHPYRNTGTRNLTVDSSPEFATWCANGCTNATRTFYPAVYYSYLTGGDFDRSSYQKVEIKSTTPLYSGDGRSNRDDCTAGVCTYAQEIQNFANWYTYYRSRMLAAQSGIGRAFNDQPETMRVGFGSINKSSTSIDGENTRTVIQGVRAFSGSDREQFFEELYTGDWPTSSTPLRRALDDVGQYFSRDDNRGPWGAIPGTNNSTNHLTCRQSFSILMTDGYWSDGNSYQASTSAARDNVDGSSGSTITDLSTPPQTYTYAAATPFSDSNSNTLADVAMYYWNRDLRDDLENEVPTSTLNPAFWQHMVTYGVGLGVSGTIDPDTAFAAITSSPPGSITWPNPTSTNSAKLDDLLHAGVNSRGGFFSAADPDEFASELSSVLTSIVARVTAAGTSAAASSATLQSDTLLYNASFRSSDWSGTLVARDLDDDGNPDLTTTAWDAEQLLAVRTDARDIFTSTEDGTAVDFDAGSLSVAQLAALAVNPTGAPASTATATDRINWLKGTETTKLRSRVVDGVTRRIGDLIGSNPQYLYQRDFGYSLLSSTEGSSYRAFRNDAGYLARSEALLVGSNGGMFHAFDAEDGEELFAYIPSELLLPGTSGTHAQINELMQTDYDHRFYVDGSSVISDVYTDSAWRTAVVGTMGAGGRTVFALDVTDPDNFDTADVMWEFKHSTAACVAEPTGVSGSRACRDIGYGVTSPKVVRLSTGRWAAVFGNGYNSYDNRARLMVVDMESGRLLYNLLTPDNLASAGSASDSNPNGLFPVETTDWPASNLNLSNTYAGDLLGNIWRFNFQNTPPTVTRLFSADDGASPAVRQPITSRPRVALKPGSTSEIVVLFGTGSFFKEGDDDTTSPQVQSFYGIFDSATPATTVASRAGLLTQVITSNASSVTIGGETYAAGSLRYVTENDLTTERGWKVDLPSPGERVISEAIFPSGSTQETVRFATLIPDDDPCGSGRQGFLMDISIEDGGSSGEPAFDVNNDGVIDAQDSDGGNYPSGLTGPTGEMPITVRDIDDGVDNIYGGDGTLITKGTNSAGPVGRQSWRQLR